MIGLSDLFRPTLDAFFSRNLPLTYRWRLIAFQPIALLTYLLNAIPCFLSRRTTTIYIPTRSGPKSCLIWRPDTTIISHSPSSLPPLHLDIHGGGFIGGEPSASHRFCSSLSSRTGCVVVGASYRFAPRHPFPAAIDDIDDVVSWLQIHASTHPSIQADPNLFTIGGSSAGGNLALAATQAETCDSHGSPAAFKACVTFYAAIDLRPPPWKKPVGQGVPKMDPMAFLQPLFDSYAGLAEIKSERRDNPRCSPITAPLAKLPEKILMIVPTVDILVHEQLTFVERIKGEIEALQKNGNGNTEEREVRAKIMEGCFHGWLELPDAVLNTNEKWKGTREEVFDECIHFLSDVHRSHGWHFQEHQQKHRASL